MSDYVDFPSIVWFTNSAMGIGFWWWGLFSIMAPFEREPIICELVACLFLVSSMLKLLKSDTPNLTPSYCAAHG